VNILLFFFNWNIFSTVVKMDIIFTEISFLPFLLLQAFGLLIILLFWVVERNKDIKQDLRVTKLQKELMEIKKNLEIDSLKKKTIEKITE
jgi:hypothetical protein